MPIYEAECSECGYQFDWLEPLPTDIDRDCPKCGGKADRLYSLSNPKFFQEFTTRNIDPQGKPITIKSQRQLSSLCNEHNLVHLDDPKEEIKPFRPPSAGEIFGKEVAPELMKGGAAKKEDVA